MTIDYLRQPPPPLSPAVEDLLAYERVIDGQSEMVRARVLARARESLRTGEVASIGPGAASVRVRRVLYAAAAGLVLMASAAAAYYQLRASARPAKEARPSRLAQAAALSPASDPGSALAHAPVAAPPATGVPTENAEEGPAAVNRVVSSLRKDSRLEELELLDRARQADARGDYASVLAITTAHDRRYPVGHLAEEREVLRVKALVGLGRGQQAREVAAKFRRSFPRSVLLPKIEEMLASLQ